MRSIEINLYKFNELSEDAQKKAIEKLRDVNIHSDWHDSVYEDAKQIGQILGIHINNIYFSGFCSQGDGACFTGSYSYSKKAHKKIREYAPKDEELHCIADRLFDLQSKHFYGINAEVEHRGHYYHEMCTYISVYSVFTDGLLYYDLTEDVKDVLRDFMRWIYRQLEKEYEYMTSDEAIAETLRINEYDFTIEGKIY